MTKRAENIKGVRGESPILNRAACGKQVDFQGAAGGKILAKIAKELFGERAESERGDNSAICSRRSIPHLCSVRGPGRIATPRAFGYFRHESNIIHDTMNNLLIEGVVKAVILIDIYTASCWGLSVP